MLCNVVGVLGVGLCCLYWLIVVGKCFEEGNDVVYVGFG